MNTSSSGIRSRRFLPRSLRIGVTGLVVLIVLGIVSLATLPSAAAATPVSSSSDEMVTVINAEAAELMKQSQQPQFIYPVDGQTLNYSYGIFSYMFKVTSVPGASGYLWGFFQRGNMVWENLRDEGHLSGTEYTVIPGHPMNYSVMPGDFTVMVRARVNDQWTEAAVITVILDG